MFTFITGVDSLVLVGRKRDRGETRSSFVVVRDFCSLTARPSFTAVEEFLHLFIGSLLLTVSCLWYTGNVARFSEVFGKCSNALFASVKVGSEITENGLLSGSEERK